MELPSTGIMEGVGIDTSTASVHLGLGISRLEEGFSVIGMGHGSWL
jgi:hypothetical protein